MVGLVPIYGFVGRYNSFCIFANCTKRGGHIDVYNIIRPESKALLEVAHRFAGVAGSKIHFTQIIESESGIRCCEDSGAKGVDGAPIFTL